MTEWLNNFFGIKNEISVPIIISLIVFIVGGIAQLLSKIIVISISRKRTRETFYTLLKKTIKDITFKEKKLFEFYPDLNIQFKGNWLLKYKILGYLNNLFSLDFKETYFAFKKKPSLFFWKYKKRDDAFHIIWECLNNLKFLEERIESNLSNFQNTFNGFHIEYNSSLNEFVKYNNESNTSYNGIKETEENFRDIDYLFKKQSIWQKWFDLGEPDRIGYFSTYNNIVLPILELNKEYSDIDLTRRSNSLLVKCLHLYAEMENCLNTNRTKFKGFYFQYKYARRKMEVCLKRLKHFT
jgi:hypothetical protein